MKKFTNVFVAGFCSLCLTVSLFFTTGGLSIVFFGEPTHPAMKKDEKEQ